MTENLNNPNLDVTPEQLESLLKKLKDQQAKNDPDFEAKKRIAPSLIKKYFYGMISFGVCMFAIMISYIFEMALALGFFAAVIGLGLTYREWNYLKIKYGVSK